MTTYVVTRKSDGEEVYRYDADAPIEWSGWEFATHEHNPLAEPPEPEPDPVVPAEWRMHVGPFKDRLGMDGLAIAASTHPVCVAAREMLAGRLYIDLLGPKAAALLDMLIATGQPAANPYFQGSGPMTAEKKALILGTKPTTEELYRG
jgi:hypothetical protein